MVQYNQFVLAGRWGKRNIQPPTKKKKKINLYWLCWLCLLFAMIKKTQLEPGTENISKDSKNYEAGSLDQIRTT